MRSLTSGKVAHFAEVEFLSAIQQTCWRTKGDSNWRYNSENISLKPGPNFRLCAAKLPAEKNPQKGARIWFAPQSHGPVLRIMQTRSSPPARMDALRRRIAAEHPAKAAPRRVPRAPSHASHAGEAGCQST